ncbi:MAG: glycoside hydrolase family 3 N-terminal domain-containing protein [Bacteroidota bacterium]
MQLTTLRQCRFLIFYVLLSVSSLTAAAQTDSLEIQTDSLDIKIGQMILFGFSGTKADTTTNFYREIREGKLGGILIYDRNITPANTAGKLKELIASYQQAAAIPLFISIDQEGGLVNRLKQKYGFPPMPSQSWMGAMNDTALTSSIASNAAKAMTGLGINLNYSPVLDVKDASNPVLGKLKRCFSSKPSVITKQAAAMIDAYHALGLLSVVKHFPGHGRSTTDSHLGVADVTKRWRPNELDPYTALIASGRLDAVMTAHIINRQLDAEGLPATLSHNIITGLLRDSLHFAGVVISDDMQMHAISKYFGLKQSIRLAIEAGNDILMFSNHIAGAQMTGPTAIFNIIKTMVLNEEISRERIDQSFERIMLLKQRIALQTN